MPIAPYSPASPWMNMNDLAQYFGQGEGSIPMAPNASFDPSVQTTMNAQNAFANEMQSPEAQAAAAPEMPPDFQMGMSAGKKTPTAPDMAGINAILKQFNSANLSGTKDSEDAINRLKMYRDAMPVNPSGVDLSPLLALSDSWSKGGKLLSGYSKPVSAEERLAKRGEVDAKIGSEAQKMSAQDMALLKEKLAGEIAKLHYGTIKSSASEDRAQARMDKFNENVVGKYNSDKSVVKALGVEDSANNIQALLDSNNAIADSSIPTYMARLSGEVGNLSEADKKPFGGSLALKAQFEQTFKRAQDGQLTDENRAFVRQLTDVLRDKAAATKEKRARELSDQYGRAHEGATPEGVFSYLAPGSEYKKKAPASSAAQPVGFKIGDVAKNKQTGQLMQKTADGWVPANQ